MAYDDKPLKKTGIDTTPQHWDEAANDWMVTGTLNNLPVFDSQASTKLAQIKTQLDEIQDGTSKAQVVDADTHSRLDTMETTLNSLETMIQGIIDGSTPATNQLTGRYVEDENLPVTIVAGSSYKFEVDLTGSSKFAILISGNGSVKVEVDYTDTGKQNYPLLTEKSFSYDVSSSFRRSAILEFVGGRVNLVVRNTSTIDQELSALSIYSV